MAGDCPHGMHLQASLQHHHHDSGGGGEEAVGGVSGILINTHEKYLQIIDELKNDLEQMSCEVVQVHNECCSHGKGGQHDASDDDEVDLTASLKELEDQNDRLQEALKLRLKEKDTAYREMEATVC
uniref:Uncharacterized protein n=1 Tax=Stomoxys calcitrans TaxID=35570 RepID=A0A1I8PI41_STOCA